MRQTDDIEYIRHTLHDRAICVLIPTFNNVGTIRHVVEDALLYCQDVIVIDDGSNDGTSEILETIDTIHLVSYQQNRGKGYALKQGFTKALELGFAYAITMDADGQHFAKDIPTFLEANKQWPGSIILGSRKKENMILTKGSSFANKFSNFWFCVQTFHHLPDTQTGFRLYPLKKLYGYRFITSRYEAELELIVFASWHGVGIHSIPVDVYYPPKEERVSHFRPGLDFTRISILNTCLCFLAIIYALPLRIFRFLATALRTIIVLLSVLLLFIVYAPLVWLYVKIGKETDKKKWNLHLLMYKVMRVITLKIGIPGARFSMNIDKNVNFDKPRIIICNHQSHLDLLYLLALTPKIIFMTNDWVWRSPLYGFLIRHAGYLHATDGIDDLMPHLKEAIKQGYSVVIFPEGTRSIDCKIARFHQGAFYVASQLELDILPIFLYGTGRVLKKKRYYLMKSPIYMEEGKNFSRQEIDSKGEVREQTKWFRKFYLHHFEEISNKIEQDV